jgi:pyruvate/2-oxoglutarate dehydrogenase complex dihydrolipoamide acyltransferase (E2) component
MRALMKPLMTVLVGIVLSGAPGTLAQTAPASTTASKPAAKPAAQAAKPTAPVAPKPAAQASAKPAAKKPAKTPAPAVRAVSSKKSVESEQKIARRDPFESLIGRKQAQDALAKNLPPGKAGLQVGTLRLDGVVKSANGMIAVVANPQNRTYFLREGDQLYDGKVDKISMEGVTFHEEGKDAFGKPVEREVNKRLYSSAGEQQ